MGSIAGELEQEEEDAGRRGCEWSSEGGGLCWRGDGWTGEDVEGHGMETERAVKGKWSRCSGQRKDGRNGGGRCNVEEEWWIAGGQECGQREEKVDSSVGRGI